MYLYSFNYINYTLTSYTQELVYSSKYTKQIIFKKVLFTLNSRFQVNRLYILLFLFVFLNSYSISRHYSITYNKKKVSSKNRKMNYKNVNICFSISKDQSLYNIIYLFQSTVLNDLVESSKRSFSMFTNKHI